MSYEPKQCAVCGTEFLKPAKYSRLQWERKQFCSNSCRGRAARVEERTVAEGRVRVWDGDRLRKRYQVVAERVLGRQLFPGEVVDHLNGDSTDDRPENLRVFGSHSAHMVAHWDEGSLRRRPEGGSVVVRPEEWPS